MKNFDEERIADAEKRKPERTFTAGGVEFHIRPFTSPEEMTVFGEVDAVGIKATAEVYDGYITGLLEEGEDKAWAKMRKEARPPLNLHDLEDIAFWAMGIATGRPTSAPSRSGAGRADSTATSKAT